MVLPLLGAVPDSAMIVASGIGGDRDDAQKEINVGMGLGLNCYLSCGSKLCHFPVFRSREVKCVFPIHSMSLLSQLPNQRMLVSLNDLLTLCSLLFQM